MDTIIQIGIIGDFDSLRDSQIKTNKSLVHASKKLSIQSKVKWIPTTSLTCGKFDTVLAPFDAILAGPGDYDNPGGAIGGIQYCREKEKPFLGT